MSRRAPLLALALVACGTARPLRPLERGQWAVEASVPGIWTGADPAYPVGQPIAGARYGLTGDKELALRLYPGALALGLLAFEGGGIWHLLPADRWRPALHLAGTLSLMTSPRHFHDGFGRSVRGAAALDATAHWEPTRRFWPYAVVQQALVLESVEPVTSLFFGGQVHLSPRWSVSFETGLAGLDERSDGFTQSWLGVGGRGAIWMAWALEWRPGAVTPPTASPGDPGTVPPGDP